MKLDARITRWLRARTANIKAHEEAIAKPKPWRANGGGRNIRGRMAMAQTNPPAYLPATTLDRFQVWAAVGQEVPLARQGTALESPWELPEQPDYIERPVVALDIIRALRQASHYTHLRVVRLNRYGGVDRVVFAIHRQGDQNRPEDQRWVRTDLSLDATGLVPQPSSSEGGPHV